MVAGWLHPRGLVLMYVVSQPLPAAGPSVGSRLFSQAVIKVLVVLPAVFFISSILISLPMNIA